MTLNRQRLLRYAEYAAVSASVAGAIAAVATRQIIYGVAPLTVTAALNLISRRQWEQRIEQRLVQTTTQVGQQFDRLVQKNRLLEQRLREGGQQPETSADNAEELRSLQAEVSQFTQDIAAELETLREAIAQPDNQERPADLSDLSAELRDLRVALAALESLGLEDRLQTVEQMLPAEQRGLEAAIAHLRSDFNQLSSDLSDLKAEVVQLTALLRAVPPAERVLPTEETEPEPAAVEPPAEDYTWAPPQLPTHQDFTLEINLGIDFGTGFTKVCFRDLANISNRSEVVTFAKSSEPDLEQALLSTQVAVLEDGRLLTGLTVAEWAENHHPVKQMMEFIKMRLAHLDLPQDSAWRLEQIPELDDPETVENICAYYLSRVIGRAQQWIQQNRADLFKNQTVRWSLNVGVPVEYCDSPALERFQKVLSLAWLLVNSPSSKEALTISSLNHLGACLRNWMHQELEGDLDCFTTPEISAAAWSLLSSREIQERLYTFFDFGDGTLDGTAFRFWRDEGELKVDFYTGQVRPLGVTAFTQQTAAELQTAPDTVRQALLEWQSATHQALNAEMQNSQTRREVQRLVAAVVMQSKQKHYANRGIIAQDDLGDKLDVYVGGGGGQNSFLQATVESTYTDFQQDRAGILPYRIKRIPVPDNLEMNGLDPEEFHRFAVAYGLCIPDWEGPEIRLPSQVEANAAPPTRWSSRVTRYEDTRDLT